MSNKICGLKNISVVVQFQFCYLVIRTWITQLTKLVIYRIETCIKVNPLISGFVKIQIADSSDYLDSPFSSYGFLLFFSSFGYYWDSAIPSLLFGNPN